MSNRIVIKRAMSTEIVEIQWIMPDKSVFWTRHSCPPDDIREAIISKRKEQELETSKLFPWEKPWDK